MRIDTNYIKENIHEFCFDKTNLIGVSEDGISLQIVLPENTDVIDFAESLGIFFYKIDDPKFGQKYISQESKNFVYIWLTQILNSGNYEDVDDCIVFELEVPLNYDKLSSLNVVLQKYKKRYRIDKQSENRTYVLAEEIAIEIIEIIEKVRRTMV